MAYCDFDGLTRLYVGAGRFGQERQTNKNDGPPFYVCIQQAIGQYRNIKCIPYEQLSLCSQLIGNAFLTKQLGKCTG